MMSEIASQLGINSSIFYLFVLICVFHLVVSNLYIKPYQKLFEQREKSTSGASRQAEDLIKKTEQMQALYMERVKDLNIKVRAIHKEQEDKAKIEAAAILQKASAEIREKAQAAQQALEAEKNGVWKQLSGETGDLAQEIVSKVLGRTA
jgi:F0F1-type ATP synthase membrane subunit b/b'